LDVDYLTNFETFLESYLSFVFLNFDLLNLEEFFEFYLLPTDLFVLVLKDTLDSWVFFLEDLVKLSFLPNVL